MLMTQTIYEQTKKLSLLFVEDDPQLRQRTVEILEDYFSRVDFAEDGIDALEQFNRYYDLKNTYYDLVISDIQMPRMDGVELTEALYALRHDQPIIILSAHTETTYLLKLINLGVAQFITKPIQFQEMLDTLYKVSLKINSLPKPSIIPSSTLPLHPNVIWDKEKKRLIKEGVDVALTKYEIHLMTILTAKYEQVCSADEILSHFFLHDIDIGADNLRGMMMRLRKKLPENSLTSVYGLGYKLSSTH